MSVSAPNIPERSNLAGQTLAEIRWRSTPNLKFLQVASDIPWRPGSSEHRGDAKSLLDGRMSVSAPNIPESLNLAGDAPELPVSNATQNTDGPRRSFWRRTKEFGRIVRRLFCCCGSINMID